MPRAKAPLIQTSDPTPLSGATGPQSNKWKQNPKISASTRLRANDRRKKKKAQRRTHNQEGSMGVSDPAYDKRAHLALLSRTLLWLERFDVVGTF